MDNLTSKNCTCSACENVLDFNKIKINDLTELKSLLSSLLISFNNSPRLYTRKNFMDLLKILTGSLWYLYNEADVHELVLQLIEVTNNHAERIDNLETATLNIIVDLELMKNDISTINNTVNNIIENNLSWEDIA